MNNLLSDLTKYEARIIALSDEFNAIKEELANEFQDEDWALDVRIVTQPS